jgi:hypothetical protein
MSSKRAANIVSLSPTSFVSNYEQASHVEPARGPPVTRSEMTLH